MCIHGAEKSRGDPIRRSKQHKIFARRFRLSYTLMNHAMTVKRKGVCWKV